ncbi:PH domain-containing protein [Microbacterium flavum]|uniref:PH domain-containing protein n=1 Tax=Microbacterium flavum TaxID=415216 RepID=A0ABS5XV04_9MICO|nr:PH domain-containing protein [Microbacterium flavum]MBT8798362.1 PH domain-containing protein [Microbacterium flavum]
MTNSPDPLSPDSASPTTTDTPTGAGAPSGADAPSGTLDRGTYDALLEPRGANRLPLRLAVGDGVWHQISRRYVTVQLISTIAFLVLVVAVALVVALVLHQVWVWIPAGVVTVITVWTLVILPRQARAYGYQLRTDDLVFRRGILWQRLVAVPYGRMQLVDITHGPLDRLFGIAQLKLVTAAAATGVTIPGLTQEAAERLRDTLVAVAETRRTGL